MKLFAALLGALALFAGFAGGVRAYSLSADAGPPPVRPVSVPHYPEAQPVRPGIVFRWAPCRAPAHREGKACVTHVTRTVALPATRTSAPAAPARPATPTHVVRTSHEPADRPSSEPTDEPTETHHEDDGGDDGGGDGGGDD